MAAPTPRRKPAAPKKASTDFEYTTASGETVTIPPFKSIKPGVLRKSRHLDPLNQTFAIIESVASDEALEVIDDFEQDEFADFQRAWFEHSGVELGEA